MFPCVPDEETGHWHF